MRTFSLSVTAVPGAYSNLINAGFPVGHVYAYTALLSLARFEPESAGAHGATSPPLVWWRSVKKNDDLTRFGFPSRFR